MGKSKKSNEIQWVKPHNRGIIPIGKLYCSKSLKKLIKDGPSFLKERFF